MSGRRTVPAVVGLVLLVCAPLLPAAGQPALGGRLSPSSAVVRGAGSTAQPSQLAAGRPLFMQFNMCGNKCSGGPRAKAAALVDSIVERGPVAVSLNEACRNQLTTVTRMLRKRHYPMNVRFKTTLKASSGACGGHDFGNAVLARARIVDVKQRTFRAQTGADEKRAILCAKARMARTTGICSTHTVHDNATIRARQIKQATSIVDRFRGPVVLMGDFNDVPLADSLDRLYAPKYGYGAPSATSLRWMPSTKGTSAVAGSRRTAVARSTTSLSRSPRSSSERVTRRTRSTQTTTRCTAALSGADGLFASINGRRSTTRDGGTDQLAELRSRVGDSH